MPGFGPLTEHYKWPQDELQIPAGGGGMPPVSFGNADVARSEYAVFLGNFAIPAAQPAGTVLSTFIATNQDGDFWCDQIAVMAWNYIAAAKGIQRLPMADMAVRDARTNRNMFYPLTVPIALFRKLSNQATTGSEPAPAKYRQTGTLIQPFCFTRQGGIQVDLSFPNALLVGNGSFQLTVMFSGWKEYANASQ